MRLLEEFDTYRPLLFSIAYRMLGSSMDAEDMVQETFMRWYRASEDEVQSPKAYLSKVVTNLCIDYMRSARVQRETYVGPWLPEPLVTEQMPDVATTVEMAESLSTAFLLLLESLSPLERAVFLLRQIFDYDYSEIAQIVGKNEANCRQIVRRAQQHLSQRRPRFDVSAEKRQQLTHEFIRACAVGDMDGLLNLLARDVIFYGDGGGKTFAARKPIYGAEKVARMLLGIAKKTAPFLTMRLMEINGSLGLVFYLGNKPFNVMMFDTDGNQIQAVYNILNPDKLSHIPMLEPAS